MGGFHMRSTCSECPWLRETPVGRFSPERYELLEPTCRSGGLPNVFGCHKSPEGAEVACAGFLLVHGHDNNRVRLAAMAGAYDPANVKATGPLYDDFDEMARENGFVPELRDKRR